MNYAWDIRAEILSASHRWPQVFLAVLLGSLLGWLASYLLPVTYHAEAELYVAYNGDFYFRNPDDYKNWQLGELEMYIYSDDVLQETLVRLQDRGPYWQGKELQDIRPLLDSYWRNAGKWRLVVETDDPERAAELATIWRNVIIDKTGQAMQQSRRVIELEGQIRALAQIEAGLNQRRAILQHTWNALSQWRQNSLDNPSPVTVLDRWRLLSLAANSSAPPELTNAFFHQFPSATAEAGVYQAWVAQAASILETELASVTIQLQELERQRQVFTTEWQKASLASYNLTAYLTIQRIRDVKPLGEPLRYPSQLAVVGALLGALAWGLFWLARPLRGARR
jgi:hypothetical protein